MSFSILRKIAKTFFDNLGEIDNFGFPIVWGHTQGVIMFLNDGLKDRNKRKVSNTRIHNIRTYEPQPYPGHPPRSYVQGWGSPNLSK